MANGADIRLLVVGPIPPPAGGMANQTAKMCHLLAESVAHLTLLPVNPPYTPSWVEKVPIVRAFFRLIPYCLRLWRESSEHNVMHIMANSGWSWHLFAVPAILVGRLRGLCVVVNYRGGDAEDFFAKSWNVVRFTLLKAQAIVVPSSFLFDIFLRRHIPTIIIPNILDVKRFYPSKDRQMGGRKGSPHVVVTRNLEAIYDVATTIRAFALVCQRFPDAHLSIAGSGPEKDALVRLSHELKISEKTSFLGCLSADEIAKLYRDADLMFNSSTIDNNPNSIIEALACGVPVVSTDVGGIPHLVEHDRDSLLVKPKQHHALAESAIGILRDPELRHRLVANGYVTVKKFSWESVESALLATYKSVLERAT